MDFYINFVATQQKRLVLIFSSSKKAYINHKHNGDSVSSPQQSTCQIFNTQCLGSTLEVVQLISSISVQHNHYSIRCSNRTHCKKRNTRHKICISIRFTTFTFEKFFDIPNNYGDTRNNYFYYVLRVSNAITFVAMDF